MCVTWLIQDVIVEAFRAFAVSNPLHPDVFPEVRKMEVCCSVLQRVAACCSVLQCVAAFAVLNPLHPHVFPEVRQMEVFCTVFQHVAVWTCFSKSAKWKCVAACCSGLQRAAACCSVLQHVAACCSVDVFPQVCNKEVCCSVLQRVAACCSVWQHVAACFSMLQGVAAWPCFRKVRKNGGVHFGVAVYCRVFQCGTRYCNVLQRVAACGRMGVFPQFNKTETEVVMWLHVLQAEVVQMICNKCAATTCCNTL